jgi:hypothetical protein
MKLSDFKITTQDLLAEIRSQLVDKSIIVIDYDKEIEKSITKYTEKYLKNDKEIIDKECAVLYSMLKERKLVRGYTSRIISAAITLSVLTTNHKDLDYRVSELIDFFKSTDVSIYAYKKRIDAVLFPSVKI